MCHCFEREYESLYISDILFVTFLQIQKFGDPNGIVQFAPESLIEKNYTEPSAVEGPQSITLFVRRIQGTLGNITVFLLFPNKQYNLKSSSVSMYAGISYSVPFNCLFLKFFFNILPVRLNLARA